MEGEQAKDHVSPSAGIKGDETHVVVEDRNVTGAGDAQERKCLIMGTVITGIDEIARSEVADKFDHADFQQNNLKGKIIFETTINNAIKAKDLRTCAKIFVVTKRQTYDTLASNFIFTLRHSITKEIDWTSSLVVLAQYFPDKSKTFSWKSSGNQQADRADSGRPSFRITCARADERSTSNRHTFTSPEAAKEFGLGLADHTGWRINLHEPDIDVLLHIHNDDVLFGVRLTEEALHRRNIVALGRTPLVGTICYSLAHLAKIQPGDVVIDPMCGGLSVPIEAALNWKAGYYIGGEIHSQGIENCATNLKHINGEKGKGKSHPIDIQQWDATNLPLRGETVDVVLCDLPFGKKVGSHAGNQTLYPKVLNEMARVTRKETGRAVLLTADKSVMKIYLNENKCWEEKKMFFINQGGLRVSVWVLRRTSEEPIIKSTEGGSSPSSKKRGRDKWQGKEGGKGRKEPRLEDKEEPKEPKETMETEEPGELEEEGQKEKKREAEEEEREKLAPAIAE